MSTQTYESVPATWLDERDVPFFRITAAAFSPAFTYGAGVLLASYDADDEPAAVPQSTAISEEVAFAPITNS